jgi:hypothetical protein
MRNWERNDLETLYKREEEEEEEEDGSSFGCVTLHCRIFDLNDLSCGS